MSELHILLVDVMERAFNGSCDEAKEIDNLAKLYQMPAVDMASMYDTILGKDK